MSNPENLRNVIEEICARDDLSTQDPYDIWMTPMGFQVKDLFNKHRAIAMLPAILLTLFDVYINDRPRFFCPRREYPIIRAWAALILLNYCEISPDEKKMQSVRKHLEWLRDNTCHGYSGPCWGLGFEYAVMADYKYDSNMPLTTMSQYPLEAFVRYTEMSGDDRFLPVILGVFDFLENDVKVMDETEEYMVTSYAAFHDRRVINAVSYVMYSYGLLLPYLDDVCRQTALRKIQKLYAYIAMHQGEDGSWVYSPEEGHRFIDCYHSCIVLKNLIKTNNIVDLPGSDEMVARGYAYVKKNFHVAEKGLYKRFTVANKPSLVRFDLYDNAEMLGMASLMGDVDLLSSLTRAVEKNFVDGDVIFSQIDSFGLRHGRNTLRWAVMPYFHSLSMISRSRKTYE